MQSSGVLDIVKQFDSIVAYQHIDNGGVTYQLNECGTLLVETSYFGYGKAVIEIPYFNKEEFIKFLQYAN